MSDATVQLAATAQAPRLRWSPKHLLAHATIIALGFLMVYPVLWMISAYKIYRVVSRLSYLESFLHVCAWCRKIEYQNQWLSIEAHFQLVRPTESDDVVIELPSQADFDDIFGVERKSMMDGDAATRPKGEVLTDPFILNQSFGDVVHGECRSDRRISNRLTADGSGG